MAEQFIDLTQCRPTYDLPTEPSDLSMTVVDYHKVNLSLGWFIHERQFCSAVGMLNALICTLLADNL